MSSTVPEHLVTERRALGISWNKLMMWLFLGSDAMSFAALLSSYAMLRGGDAGWPIPAEVLGIPLTAAMTFTLIVSSVTMVRAFQAIQLGDAAATRRWLGWTMLGGVLFLGGQAWEWTHLMNAGMSASNDNFDATFFCITGFHGCHVFVGVLLLALTWWMVRTGRIGASRAGFVENIGLYWHFVDLIWILVFTFVYLI